MMTAKEFRDTWLKMNPNVVHIPSEHELGLMDAYARYFHDMEVKKKNKRINSVCEQCRFESECRFKSENTEQDCKFFIDKQTVL